MEKYFSVPCYNEGGSAPETMKRAKSLFRFRSGASCSLRTAASFFVDDGRQTAPGR